MKRSLLILCLFASVVMASKLILHKRLRDHPHHMLLETPDGQQTIDGLEALLMQLKSRPKRAPQRRCGGVLISYIVKLCKGCVDSPSKRSIRSIQKRSSDDLTVKCCRNACSDEDLMGFCC